MHDKERDGIVWSRNDVYCGENTTLRPLCRSSRPNVPHAIRPVLQLNSAAMAKGAYQRVCLLALLALFALRAGRSEASPGTKLIQSTPVSHQVSP